MSRKVLAIAASIVLVLGLQIPPAKASMYWHHYTVIYDCVCGPCSPVVEGEWELTCDDQWVGWGWEPGHECSRTEPSSGLCDPGGG